MKKMIDKKYLTVVFEVTDQEKANPSFDRFFGSLSGKTDTATGLGYQVVGIARRNALEEDDDDE